MLLDGGSEFLIRPSPDTAERSAEAAAAAAAGDADTDTVRDSSSGGGRPSVSTDCMDTAVMSEADTYRDFHSAFVVSC